LIVNRVFRFARRPDANTTLALAHVAARGLPLIEAADDGSLRFLHQRQHHVADAESMAFNGRHVVELFKKLNSLRFVHSADFVGQVTERCASLFGSRLLLCGWSAWHLF